MVLVAVVVHHNLPRKLDIPVRSLVAARAVGNLVTPVILPMLIQAAAVVEQVHGDMLVVMAVRALS